MRNVTLREQGTKSYSLHSGKEGRKKGLAQNMQG
jgi:hypothetical protein